MQCTLSALSLFRLPPLLSLFLPRSPSEHCTPVQTTWMEERAQQLIAGVYTSLPDMIALELRQKSPCKGSIHHQGIPLSLANNNFASMNRLSVPSDVILPFVQRRKVSTSSTKSNIPARQTSNKGSLSIGMLTD